MNSGRPGSKALALAAKNKKISVQNKQTRLVGAVVFVRGTIRVSGIRYQVSGIRYQVWGTRGPACRVIIVAMNPG